MKYSRFLGLKLPEQEDFYNVDDFNSNSIIIEENIDQLRYEAMRRVINAGYVPSIQAGPDASKPAPGTVGRLYIATDTQIIYRDTGTAWQKVGVVNWNDIAGKPTSFTPSAHASTHASGGSDPITPAQIGATNILSTPTIIYVDPLNGNDSYPGTQQQPFKTIQAALDSLKNTWIPNGVTVTIQLAPGIYSYTSPIVVDHPCGSRIQIVGATPVSTTITGNGAVIGSAGNWTVPIIVQSTSSISVGDYVIVSGTTGTGDHYAIRGVWQVLSVDSSAQITVKNTHRASTFPTFTLSSGTVTAIKSHLYFSGCPGIAVVNGSYLGLISNVVVVGDGSNNTGVYAADSSTLIVGNNVGVTGFGGGGFLCMNNSFIYAPSSTSSGNGENGFACSLSSAIYAPSSTSSGNGENGYYVWLQSAMYVYGYTGSPTFSPALGTVGNANSIIST